MYAKHLLSNTLFFKKAVLKVFFKVQCAYARLLQCKEECHTLLPKIVINAFRIAKNTKAKQEPNKPRTEQTRKIFFYLGNSMRRCGKQAITAPPPPPPLLSQSSNNCFLIILVKDDRSF